MTFLRGKLPWIIATAVLLFGMGVIVGVRLCSQREHVSSQLILTALHDRGFLVTQTFMFDTPVTITRSTGSAFKDFFVGQTIEARGTMEVNLGIDLAGVTNEDVTVDPDGTVVIRVPPATLFNTRLVGPIELKNRQGVLKRLFDADNGYNEALVTLSKTAEASAARPELLERANERAREDIIRLLGTVVRSDKIRVVIKQ